MQPPAVGAGPGPDLSGRWAQQAGQHSGEHSGPEYCDVRLAVSVWLTPVKAGTHQPQV